MTKKEKQSARHKAYYAKNRTKRLAHKKAFRDAHKEERKARRQALKAAAFEHYGKICQCCGETEPAFLVLDHIYGGGNKERATKGLRSGSTFHAWLKKNKYPVGYQVLCHNCNWGKHIMGVCPHKKRALSSIRRTPHLQCGGSRSEADRVHQP